MLPLVLLDLLPLFAGRRVIWCIDSAVSLSAVAVSSARAVPADKPIAAAKFGEVGRASTSGTSSSILLAIGLMAFRASCGVTPSASSTGFPRVSVALMSHGDRRIC